MLQQLREMLRDLTGADDETPFAAGDERLAEAALLVHAMAIDGVVDTEERDAVRSVLKREYGLGGHELDRLLSEAKEADAEAVDLYRFTSVLKRRLDRDGRLRVVRNLWRIVYADGIVHEFEDNLVWRIAELLGIDRHDRIALRQAVERERSAGS